MLAARLLAALAVLAAPPVHARRHAPELREDDPPRRSSRPAECQFGKQAKELGSTWFADLGPPFGVMYCIKCECLPVQKKRRVVAKVQCRNIKSECPEPSCDTPELLPGRCCKTCPGDINSPDVLQEDSPMVVTAEEDELSMKRPPDFGALLSGRSPLCIRRDDMSPVGAAAGVATARFTFHRRHLYWSLLLGARARPARPRALLFLDRAGRLLLEHPLRRYPGVHALYEDATDKICGVWRRVPREYKRILREGMLYVALIWGDERNATMDSAISGRINRYPALANEMFSSLLEPEQPPAAVAAVAAGGGGCDETRGAGGWWGATAVVTGVAGAAPSLHVALMYNGVFAPHETRDAAVRLLLQAHDKNFTIIDEVQKVPKPGHEINVLEVSTPVTAAELRALSRGRLQLSLESVAAPALRVRGAVRQRASCELFQAPLLAERLPAEAPAAGLAWMYIDRDGSLVYDIQVDNLSVKMPKITLVDDFGKRHSQVEILDTMSGVLARPSARIFSPLYEEQLAVHISTDTGPLLLRGRLVSRPLPDAVSSGPVLLRRTDGGRPANLVGVAWLAVDSLCSIHYEISIAGGEGGAGEAWLETWAVAAAAAAGGAGGRARALPGIDGCVLEPTGGELAALHAGAAFLDVRALDNVTVLLRARLQQISVPPACLPAVTWSSDNDLSPSGSLPTHVNPPPDNSIADPASCFYADRFYDDGSQWMSTESCNMCGCVHGSVRCDPVRCPPVSCAVPVLPRPGECCPICTNTSTAPGEWNASRSSVAGCYLAGQFHSAGSSWHPYLVPGGYDTCAVCTCDYTSLVVRCPRVTCPPLRCADKDAYRPDKKACCRLCPETKEKKSEDGTLRDEGTPRTAAEILADGGCVFPEGPLPNGKEVHPSVHSHGEQKCVTCRCKDGVVTCVRTRCGRGACSKRRRTDSCCACRRHRRHRQPRLDPPPQPS